jgi:aerobic C4-dicarboxylate transport protein
MRRIYKGLCFQVIVAIIQGIILGVYQPAFAKSQKPLGDVFIKLVKMMIAPIIFATIINLIGNAIAVVVVAKWGSEIDPEVSKYTIG